MSPAEKAVIRAAEELVDLPGGHRHPRFRGLVRELASKVNDMRHGPVPDTLEPPRFHLVKPCGVCGGLYGEELECSC